ncbi:MAG: hypothetical protein JOZ05_23135, partial [Acetobacteraceae bacterium]|nr:hypothetical protein [Acetobacteraceae bacterium]
MSDVAGLEGLETLVRECETSGVGRRALLLRTDALPPALSRPHHLRLARQALDPLTMADRARLHQLPSGRVAVSWRGDSASLLKQTLDALEALLHDAPLDAPGMPELVGVYALPGDAVSLLREARAGVSREEPAADPSIRPAPSPAPLLPLDAAALHDAEKRLALADVTRFARRRPICRLGPSGMQLAWDERYLSIPELMETVAPGRDPEAEPWLLRRLTRVLDRRMLSLLSRSDELRGAGPFALALNVASLLSPEFLRFDAALPPGLRGRVVLLLSPADVMADPAAFGFARNFARARQYRVGLAEVPSALLPLLSLPEIAVDFVVLRWSAELGGLSPLPENGTARWILCAADDQDALEWGR